MLECKSIYPQLSTYLDHEIPLWKAGLIQWHIKRCPNCAHEIMRLRQADKVLHQLHPVKTRDSFLSDVMRQVSTISAHEKQQISLIRRTLQRLESWLALVRYSLRTRTRPYAVATALALVMTIAGVATWHHPSQLSLPPADPPILAQSRPTEQIVLFEFDIVSIDQLPKPHLSWRNRSELPQANPD